MSRFCSVMSVFFPAVVLLIYDNPVGALMALALQGTVIGWIPATMWAWRVCHPDAEKAKKPKTEQSGDINK